MFDEWDMNGYIIIVHYFVISYFIGSSWFFMVLYGSLWFE